MDTVNAGARVTVIVRPVVDGAEGGGWSSCGYSEGKCPFSPPPPLHRSKASR